VAFDLGGVEAKACDRESAAREKTTAGEARRGRWPLLRWSIDGHTP
jgi:hypothetical protein